ILKMYPAEEDALYNVAFIALGQEEFDIAQRYFDRLAKNKDNSFEVMFGAGICSYQNQKFNEAVEYFKYAVTIQPESEIANLAMILSLMKKRDFRSAVGYATKLAAMSEDIQIKYISLRAIAFLDALLKKYESSVKKFEELLEFTKRYDLQEEMCLVLYDIGFACIKAEFSKRAYEYWNDLSSIQRGFRDVQDLVMGLRREMESNASSTAHAEIISDKTEEWLLTPFPPNFLWGICTLKNEKKFDLRNYMVSTRVSTEGDSDYSEMGYSKDLLEKFINLDTENFRIIANRVVNKMGYKVDQIMPTYRDSDGIDFLATKRDTKEKTFVWVRRWKKTRVGEIPMRNFAQMVNDQKAAIGLFVTTSDLTEEAQGTVANLSKVKVILPDELNSYLQGLL
ncbi:MAG TPA: restriction endonuclease, partial [Spirochaetota bacterium]